MHIDYHGIMAIAVKGTSHNTTTLYKICANAVRASILLLIIYLTICPASPAIPALALPLHRP